MKELGLAEADRTAMEIADAINDMEWLEEGPENKSE